MYRVLLVEDEEIIRKGIRYSVPWEEAAALWWARQRMGQ